MYKYVFLNSFGVLSPFMEAISLNRKKKKSLFILQVWLEF